MRIIDWSSDVCSSDLFADMVMNNDIFRHYLFLNESKQTSVLKPRFFAYYSPDQQGNIDRSLTLILSAGIHDDKLGVNIRVSRARSEERSVGKECVSTCRFWRTPYH